MGWGILIPAIGLVLVLCFAVPVLWWGGRRIWLARSGGVFVCELNRGTPDRPIWVLGLARYSGENLEWFRALSLGLNPAFTVRRSATRARVGPSAAQVAAGQRVLQLEATDRAGTQAWELAMEDACVTGLLAWLEAAPPSLDRFKA